jgi:xylan 1,4-beta-xylosidase
MSDLYNPVLAGFHPDPSITRVGDTYYLVTSTFEYYPGIPVYASEDLRDWRLLGNVIERPEQGRLEEVPTNGGVWAPTIRHRDGVFHVIVTIAMGRGCVVYSTTDPAGPWDDGVLIDGIEGIDPDLAWDDAGTAIVTYSGLNVKGPDFGTHKGIRQVDVDLATGELLSDVRDIWSGVGGMFPEAPHLHRHGDHWYLWIAEGGTERGHGESVARASDPRGPFENGPANPIVSARSTSRPVQNTGHGDLVAGPDGDVLILLGVRPRGGTRAFSALGRETFATPVTWEDGWPKAEPVALNPRPGDTVEDIAFDAPLDAGWLAIRRTPGSIADLAARPGRLTLHGEGADLTAQSTVFVGRRQLNQTATVATTVDAVAGSGGLAVRYDEDTVYSIRAAGSLDEIVVRAEARVPGIVQTWEARFPVGPVELEISSVRPTGMLAMTSDLVRLVARQGDREEVLAEVDGRSLSAETAASFTGRVLGLFAVTGDVSFDGWRYRGSED